MKTILISLLSLVLFFALLFGLMLLFTPVLLSVVPIVWHLKSSGGHFVKRRKSQASGFEFASC